MIRKRTKTKNRNGQTEYLTDIDPSKGLSSEQVAALTKEGKTNRVKNTISKTYGQIFISNVCTFFNLICLIVAIAILTVGAYSDAFFVLIVLMNTIIGIAQEIRAKRTVDRLSLLSSASAEVIRDGKKQKINSSQIVLGDVLALSAGDQISADCILIEGFIEANESLLTGESLPIKKYEGDKLLSGSFVQSGKCICRTEKVGYDSYAQQLTQKAKKYIAPKSDLLRSLNNVIKAIGIVIIPIAIVVFINNHANNGGDIVNTITQTAGSIIGMIPAGMFLLTSVALSVGVINLSQRKTLVKNIYCIEMLARANVLCLDKTGTLTDGKMSVKEYVSLNGETEKAYSYIATIINATGDRNFTAVALREKFSTHNALKTSASFPFSSATKYSGAVIDGVGTILIGAPEFIPHKPSKTAQTRIDEYVNKGFRVLMLTKSPQNYTSRENFSEDFSAMGFVILEDNIRSDAKETIRHFTDNGVDVKIISGDNPSTVANVAKLCEVPSWDKYVSLEGMTDEQIKDSVAKYTVFGRVTPEQKCAIVKALKENGMTVAMTGDGVNDILAMKEADCSIGMASGSEAARSISHLLLLENNFSSLPYVVYEGRRVINNINKSSSLFTMKTVFVILLSIISICLNMVYPFSPKMMLPIELFIIGFGSFFLALQPNKDIVKGKFLRTLLKNSVPAGITLTLSALFPLLFCRQLGYSQSDVTSIALICFTATCYVIFLMTCRPLNLYRAVLAVCVLVSIVIFMLSFPTMLEIGITFDTVTVIWILAITLCSILFYVGINYLIKFATEKK